MIEAWPLKPDLPCRKETNFMRCFRLGVLRVIGALLFFPAISSAIERAAGTISQGPLMGMEFASIPSGSFSMGSPSSESGRSSNEGPVHTVNIQSFEMMTTEVTQRMWKEVMGTTIQHLQSLSKYDHGLFGTGPDYPMYYVSWDDAQAFVYALNQLDTEYEYRLPSESEWEYACRAGTTTRFYWGNDPDSTVIDEYAWYIGNSGTTSHPVAQKLPNAWGLYDMSGNVVELCQDYWHDDYSGAPSDGSAWVSLRAASLCVGRGGCWCYFADFCRSALRGDLGDPRDRFPFQGFRLARSVRTAISSASEPAVGTISQESLSGMKFVSIPSGSFEMGSLNNDERPVHTVTIQSFEMMTTEVTQGMWEEVMGTTIQHQHQQRTLVGYDFGLPGIGPDYPMYYVSWNDCQEFITRMNDLDSSYTYRLPSEAEWEYACRAGTTTAYYWGNDPDYTQIDYYCWWYDNSNNTTHPVGQKLPNAWGLYDMSGNVAEWCQDWLHNGYSGAPTDGSAWVSPAGSYRVERGGAQNCLFAIACDSASRGGIDPDDRLHILGFRLTRSAR
jgi:formylglycine-generating enzyme required for sulfatase activity